MVIFISYRIVEVANKREYCIFVLKNDHRELLLPLNNPQICSKKIRKTGYLF